MSDPLTFEGLRLDHPAADIYAFIKTHGRDEHSPFLKQVAGYGLIVIDASGKCRNVKFNIVQIEGRSQKALMPAALEALQSARSGEHVHFILDQNYFIEMLNQGAGHRLNSRYRRRNGKPYADVNLWRDLDVYVTEHVIGISACRPVSNFAQRKLEETSHLGSQAAKYAAE